MLIIRSNSLSTLNLKTLVLFSLGTIFSINSSFATEQQEIKEIEALYSKWKIAVETSDIDSYLSNLHEDIRLRPPAGDPVDGIENYRRFLGPVFSSATYKIQVDESPVITIFGNNAIAEYDYTIQRSVLKNAKVTLEKGAITESVSPSSYVDFLTKRPDGSWSVYLHTWRSRPEK